jgi:hypothetical protein
MRNKINRCGDCKVREGELHLIGCDKECCPFCGGQLVTCNCEYKYLKLYSKKKYTSKTCYLSARVYYRGISEKQNEKWQNILEIKGRRPYIRWPNICVYCGELWPRFFSVPDIEWRKYVDVEQRKEMLCEPCYNKIKHMIQKFK